MRQRQGKCVVGWAALLGLAVPLMTNAVRAGETPPVEAVLDYSQPVGAFDRSRFTNATYEAIYGQTASVLADGAFGWVRAGRSLSYVRCFNWLGDGVPQNQPGWFSGCRVVTRNATGSLTYRWEALERVIDTLLASGVRPMIVCGGLPDALARPPLRRNDGGQLVNSPADYAAYQELISQMVRRLVKTYGVDEVRKWHFEAWSQPDHEGSWEHGRPAPFEGDPGEERVRPFLRLYDAFCAGIDSVDPEISVGGPGLAGDLGFLRRFLTHCVRPSGSIRPRLNFVSFSRYGPSNDVLRWTAEIRQIIASEFPMLKSVRFYLTECGSGPVEGRRAHTAYEAARLAALVGAMVESNSAPDLMFRAGDLVDDHFNGFRPLMSQVGDRTVPLPAFKLNLLLSRLGAERVQSKTGDGIHVLGTRLPLAAGKFGAAALVYRYDPSLLPGLGDPKSVRIKFIGLPRTLVQAPLRIYRIDPEKDNPYETWLAAGKPSPAPPDLAQRVAGKPPAAPDIEDLVFEVRQGASIDLELPPNSVALVTLGSEAPDDREYCKRATYLRQAEGEFVKAAELLEEDPDKGIPALRAVSRKYADTYWREAALYGLVGFYDLSARSPSQADRVRREMLALPLDDTMRLSLLYPLRADAVRRNSAEDRELYDREIRSLEKRLLELRDWPLRRLAGG